MCTGQRLAVFVDLVEVGFQSGAVDSRCLVVGGFDPNAQFDALTEAPAEGVDDRGPEVAFDLVLDEGTGDREESESLGDRQRSDQLQPRTLLGSKGRLGDGVAAVSVGVAVEFCDDRAPDGGEVGTGVVTQ